MRYLIEALSQKGLQINLRRAKYYENETNCGGNARNGDGRIAVSLRHKQRSTGSEDTSDVQISTDRTDTEKTDPADSTTSAVTETTEQTTTAPEEPEVPVKLPILNVEPKLIMNGCMAFKCDGKNYVYNITDNELYETE